MILSQYIGKDPTAFNDPTGGYNIASSFYKQGAAVVYHAAGGSGDGLFKAAQEVKKLGHRRRLRPGPDLLLRQAGGDQGTRCSSSSPRC